MQTNRYISAIEADVPIYRTDFLIIGSGIAGLFTALKASALGQVVVLTKKSLKDSNTGLAQGGIAAAVHEEDSPFLHLEDTLEAGAGLCDIEAVDILVTQGPARVRELIDMGARFDTVNGSVSLTREAAHSKARILHAADATGEAIRQALVENCVQDDNIHIKENQFLIDILTLGDQCCGALVYDSNQRRKEVYLAKATIVATGGAGQLFHCTTNPDIATGDGMAASFRAGCELSDMEFIQFHPTVLAVDISSRFLISEAVRGEGARLLNINRERFMPSYHPLGDLAPRDIVARAIWKEMGKTNSDHVFLDVSHLPNPVQRFPNIYRTCLENGCDLTQDLIPVSPAAHYIMGGIKTNTSGETSIYGLYACGETSCTGVHGANRLASNSLLEGLVFGQRIVDEAHSMIYRRNIQLEEILATYDQEDQLHVPTGKRLPQQVRMDLRRIMWENVGIIRDEQSLKKAARMVDELNGELGPGDDELQYYQVLNMLTIAQVMIQAALWRKESRGAHFRRDYPATDNIRWAEHLIFRNW